MAYHNEKANVDAAGDENGCHHKMNSDLAEKTADLEQVEKIKENQRKVYKQKFGQEVSLIQ